MNMTIEQLKRLLVKMEERKLDTVQVNVVLDKNGEYAWIDFDECKNNMIHNLLCVK